MISILDSRLDCKQMSKNAQKRPAANFPTLTMTSLRKKLGLGDFQVFSRTPPTQQKVVSDSGEVCLW